MIYQKKVLIFGGEGFIGRNLSDVLSDNYDCYSSDRGKSFFPGGKANFLCLNPYKDKLTGHYDVVINLIDNNVSAKEAGELEKKVLRNLDLISPEHVIFFSSASTYMFPDSEYAQRKLLIEDIYQEYCRKREIGLSTLRLFNIFGPYQLPNRKGSLIANIIYNYFAGEPIAINDMKAKRDFIYSKDMARCVEKIIENKLYGNDDLATNKMTSIAEMINKIEQHLPYKLKIIDNNVEEIENCPDASSQAVSFIEPTTMEQSLGETLKFYKNNWRLMAGNQHVKK